MKKIKVLQVTPEAPGRKSGGQYGILQSALSLFGSCDEVDYIGPHIEDDDIRNKYHYLFEILPDISVLKMFLIMIKCETNRTYFKWKNEKPDLLEYDFVFLDFTRQDYVAIDVKKYNLPLVVRVHNIEYDYTRKIFERDKNIRSGLNYAFSYKQEKKVINCADKLLVLCEEDKKRINQLYHFKNDVIFISPVCLESKNNKICYVKHYPLRLLISGSLWYGPNVEGTIWFIKNVLPNIKDSVELVVAGYRPSESLKTLCTNNNVCLVGSPKSMDDFYRRCDLVVIPIFDGTGMKVKLAEALSYGKPVIATREGARGYAIEDIKSIKISNDKVSFIKGIEEIIEMGQSEYTELVECSMQAFEDYYSIEKSIVLYNSFIGALIR